MTSSNSESPHTCPPCGRLFETRRGLGVHHSAAHDEHLPNRECTHCGEAFYSEYEKKYCSEACLSEVVPYAGEQNPNYRGGKTETTCRICGNTFNSLVTNWGAIRMCTTSFPSGGTSTLTGSMSKMPLPGECGVALQQLSPEGRIRDHRYRAPSRTDR